MNLKTERPICVNSMHAETKNPIFILIAGAGLTTKSIFYQGQKNPVTYYSKKVVWSDGSGSDLFAVLKAYKVPYYFEIYWAIVNRIKLFYFLGF